MVYMGADVHSPDFDSPDAEYFRIKSYSGPKEIPVEVYFPDGEGGVGKKEYVIENLPTLTDRIFEKGAIEWDEPEPYTKD